MNSVNPPSRVLRIVVEEHGDETEGGEATWKITAPAAERLVKCIRLLFY